MANDDNLQKGGYFKYLIPSLVGVLVGTVAYLAYFSNVASYLSNDPKACVNCHIMAPEYSTWFHSSHSRHTTCNDCHVPQDNFFKSYYFKAMDGMRHAYMFTFRLEPQTITMHAPGQMVVQENCIRCHSTLNSVVGTANVTSQMAHHGEGKLCWECHREVPHGNVRGLSSAPNARVPLTTEPVPQWLKDVMANQAHGQQSGVTKKVESQTE